MERITLTRVPIESPSECPPLRITIRVKKRAGSVAFFGAVLVVWTYAELKVGLPRSWFSSPTFGFGAVEAVLMLAFAAAGPWLACRLAWAMAGKETFLITPRLLRVRRSIGPVGFTRCLAFGEDGESRRSPGDESPVSCCRICWENGHRSLLFRYRRRSLRVAQDLDRAEAAYLLTALRQWTRDN